MSRRKTSTSRSKKEYETLRQDDETGSGSDDDETSTESGIASCLMVTLIGSLLVLAVVFIVLWANKSETVEIVQPFPDNTIDLSKVSPLGLFNLPLLDQLSQIIVTNPTTHINVTYNVSSIFLSTDETYALIEIDEGAAITFYSNGSVIYNSTFYTFFKIVLATSPASRRLFSSSSTPNYPFLNVYFQLFNKKSDLGTQNQNLKTFCSLSDCQDKCAVATKITNLCKPIAPYPENECGTQPNSSVVASQCDYNIIPALEACATFCPFSCTEWVYNQSTWITFDSAKILYPHASVILFDPTKELPVTTSAESFDVYYRCATLDDKVTCAVNSKGVTTCGCPAGYIDPNQIIVTHPETLSCQDINECLLNASICNAQEGSDITCVNTIGSYECVCETGFAMQTNSDGLSICVDTNECSLGTDHCDNQTTTCANLVGSYQCNCLSGYTQLNAWTCSDINECSNNVPPCDTNAQCTNLPGTYTCTCNAGFSGNGHNCTFDCPTGMTPSCSHCNNCSDINECILYGISACQDPFATCVNTIGSYSCQCVSGYYYNTTYKHCLDINECIANPGICGLTSCSNLIGSYQCICNQGAFFNTSIGSCQDINECLNPIVAVQCSNLGGICQNEPGTFSCLCATGMQWNANFTQCIPIPVLICSPGYTYNNSTSTCVDNNECLLHTDDCTTNATCSNTQGSYFCTCNHGFSGNGTSCSDINECVTIPTICGTNAQCTNLVGSYSCTCNSGYSMQGIFCLDINECNVTVDPCISNPAQHCVNTPGSYTCSCNTGYLLESENCLDINECTALATPCINNLQCTNLPGTYSCGCQTGYHLTNGNTLCVDTNECLDNSTCNTILGSTCVNTIGSYTCNCSSGYTTNLITHACSDVNECLLGSDLCVQTCINTNGSYFCGCSNGYLLANDGISCNDINECTLNMSNCEQICNNTIGGYICSCSAGFSLNSTNNISCLDIDECQLETDHCNQNCINTFGSYACTCNPGYVLNLSNPFSCIDFDECTSLVNQTHGVCEQNCINLPGSYGCGCDTGFVLNHSNGITCTDYNECVALPEICQSYGNESRCENTMGSFFCTCQPGFELRLVDNSVLCMNRSNCLYSDCQAHAVCNNQTMQCVCEDGFTPVENTSPLACIRTNGPCFPYPCGSGHTMCIETNETIRCDCRPGYEGNPLIDNDCVDIDECNTTDLAELFLEEALGAGLGPGQQSSRSAPNYFDLAFICPSVRTSCVNIPGGFLCPCAPGFQRPGYWNQTSEATLNASYALQQQCVGILECYLAEFLLVQSDVCIDINECTDPLYADLVNQTCLPPFIQCVNHPGTFSCECGSGFATAVCSRTECDGNHSINNLEYCDNFCLNTVNSSDINLQQQLCIDIDECLDPYLCGVHYNNGSRTAGIQQCINTAGSFYCQNVTVMFVTPPVNGTFAFNNADNTHEALDYADQICQQYFDDQIRFNDALYALIGNRSVTFRAWLGASAEDVELGPDLRWGKPLDKWTNPLVTIYDAHIGLVLSCPSTRVISLDQFAFFAPNLTSFLFNGMFNNNNYFQTPPTINDLECHTFGQPSPPNSGRIWTDISINVLNSTGVELIIGPMDCNGWGSLASGNETIYDETLYDLFGQVGWLNMLTSGSCAYSSFCPSAFNLTAGSPYAFYWTDNGDTQNVSGIDWFTDGGGTGNEVNCSQARRLLCIQQED